MRVRLAALGLFSLYSTAQAAVVNHLSSRAACGTDMKCNADGCAGTNDFNNPKQSYCTSGDCAGQPCASVCTDKPGPCGDQGCNGFLDGGNWWCSAGDFKGCSCTSICPAADQIPECSNQDCNGSSNTNQKFGICGAGKFPSCTCKNSCPSEVPKCTDDGCKGINDPDGDKSVCTTGPSMGCPCNSECPTGKCNEIDGCEGYNNVDGKSLCSAGASIGCYCDAVCPTDKVTCSDDKCNGVQPKSGSGDGFCIAGDFKGCPCATKCPDSKPACNDDKCDGVAGRCNIGDSKGCECTGNDASLTKRSFALFKRVEPNGYSNIPSSSYTCQSLIGQDDGGQVTYSSVEIEDAMRQGWQLYLRHDGVRAQNGRWYPNRFVNDGTFIIPTYINQNDLREFPLTQNTNGGAGFREGDDPGPDRVIYEGATGRFAGVVTHRGEPGNEFHQVYGHGNNPNFRTPNGAGFEPAPIRGPTNIDVDPLAYVWGTHMDGSNGLWAKRDTAETPGGTQEGNNGGNGDDVGKAVCGAGQGNPAKTFDVAYGDAAINYFCSQGGTRQIASSSIYNKEAIYGQQDLPDDKQTTDVAVITRMYYVNVPGCTTKAGAVYEPSIDDCKKGFSMAMNECQTDTTDKKAASYKVQNLGDKGCVAFDLMPCPEVDKRASNDCDPFYGDYAKFKLG